MTIEQIRELKLKLAKDISEKVEAFQKETGLSVKTIELEQGEYGNGQTILMAVNVRLNSI